jgi:hypothetical protein
MESRCIKTKKGIRCFKEDASSNAFKESRDFFVKSVERMNSDAPFRIVKNCKIQGVECFDRNARNAARFFITLLVAGVLLNLLHEIVHYAFFVMAGYTDFSFTFSATLGFTIGTGPVPGDPTIPWYWWYFVTMGPLVMVNLMFVMMTMTFINHDMKNPPFMDSHVSTGFRLVWVTFLKAMAYTSAFTILTNTIFSPFYNMVYAAIGLPTKKSDFTIAWETSLYVPEPFGMVSRVLIIGTVAIMVVVTIMYIFLHNRRETGE